MSNTPGTTTGEWLRDVDGTGSMRPCEETDTGAVEYVPADQSFTNLERVELAAYRMMEVDMTQKGLLRRHMAARKAVSVKSMERRVNPSKAAAADLEANVYRVLPKGGAV